jgi:hypothetical protein
MRRYRRFFAGKSPTGTSRIAPIDPSGESGDLLRSSSELLGFLWLLGIWLVTRNV